LKAAWQTAAQVEEPTHEHSTMVNPSLRNAVMRDVLLVARKRSPQLAAKWLDDGMVSVYGGFDSQAAFEWFAYAVSLMRGVALVSLSDDTAPSFKRISGVTPATDFTNHTTGFSLRAAVAVFTPEQFEQVLYTIKDITPQEARGTAIVVLCSNLLKAMKNED
jgi:hypothetical protein